jgi:hypothetical protein
VKPGSANTAHRQPRTPDTSTMRQFVNRWGSTFIFASFVITSVTGILLFYRIHTPPTEALHIWIGFLMIAAALFHIARNWRQFLAYFRRPAFYGALMVTLLISGWFSYPVLLGSQSGERTAGGPPGLRSAITIGRAVAGAPLSDIAPLAHTDASGLMARLSGMGIVVSDPGATLQSVADSAGRNPQELAAALLGEDGSATARRQNGAATPD